MCILLVTSCNNNGVESAETVSIVQESASVSVPSATIQVQEPAPSVITPINTPIPTIEPTPKPTIKPKPVVAKKTEKPIAIKSTAPVVPVVKNTVKPNSGYFIIVNISTNRLTLFKDDDKIASYVVATGTINNGVSLTRTGRFSVISKTVDPTYYGGFGIPRYAGGAPGNPLGRYWIGYSGNFGIHGNADESSIGKYISHGCTRMHNYEIESVFDLVSIGSKVWVGTTDSLTNWGAKNFE